MANSLSSKKRARASLRKNIRNKPIRTQTKTAITKANNLINSGDLEAAGEAVKQAITVLDKTASKGVIHSNNAARRKSRLIKRLKKAQNATAPAE